MVSDTSRPVPLGPQLWVNLASYMVIRGSEEIALDRQEAKLLALLLSSSRCYLPSESIAIHIVSLDDAEQVEDYRHCVQDAIYRLRQKLRDTEHTIVRCKRGVGYGVFPQI